MLSTKSSFKAFALCFLVLQLFVRLTLGQYCPGCGDNICPDGSSCSPFSCCASGGCNIFCCDCDGNCNVLVDGLHNDLKKRDVRFEIVLHEDNSPSWTDTINSVDTNRDGNITFLEWASYATRRSHTSVNWETLAARWARFDIEGKGYMTVKEAYKRKA